MNETKVFDESLLFHTSFEAPSVVETVPESRSYISVNAISGQIIGAAADNGYHRHYFRKLYDKFAYKSRMSDVVQTITVRCREGMVDKDVLVMCYGKINGGVTAIRTGSSIEAEGKFDRKNRFIAKRIRVNDSDIEIKTELSDLLIYLLPVILLGMILLWSPIKSVLSGTAGRFLSVITAFGVGMFGILRLIRRRARYFIPYRFRIKAGLVAGLVLAVAVLILTR